MSKLPSTTSDPPWRSSESEVATSGFASKFEDTCEGPAMFVDRGSCRTVIFPYSSPASELTTAHAVKFSRPPLGTNGV